MDNEKRRNCIRRYAYSNLKNLLHNNDFPGDNLISHS
jgi:hypothetical protein